MLCRWQKKRDCQLVPTTLTTWVTGCLTPGLCIICNPTSFAPRCAAGLHSTYINPFWDQSTLGDSRRPYNLRPRCWAASWAGSFRRCHAKLLGAIIRWGGGRGELGGSTSSSTTQGRTVLNSRVSCAVVLGTDVSVAEEHVKYLSATLDHGEHGVPRFVVAILRKRSRDHLSLWDTWDRIGKNSNELVPLASCPSMRYSGGSSKSGKVWISRGLAEGTQFLLLSPLPHGTKRTLAGHELLARADPFSDAEY